jgi:chemotaxis family two-component system response regulator Rcp1
LIVEDNPADVLLIRQAIKSACVNADLHIVRDGEQAVRYFDDVDGDRAPRPALVVLDINLPRKQGGEVIQYMRKSRSCENALVLAVSTSDSAREREHMTRLGASGYFRKPSEYAEFMKLGDIIRDLLNPANPTSKPPTGE